MLRTRPLVAVVFRVPLFLEALAAACEGIADVQGVRSGDGALEGLVRALRPDALIAEGPVAPAFDLGVPEVHVDLERRTVQRLVAGEWRPEEVELSGEAIRNVALDALFAGAEA